VVPLRLPRAVPWSTVVQDPQRGPVRLSGELRPAAGAHGLVVVIPGLGGNVHSVYVRRAVRDLARRGWATLVVPQRGADLTGEDYYHASLSADLHAAAGSPEARAYERVFFLGFSMGGHVALRFAADPPPPHVRAVAAVCAPIDLFAAQRHFDRPGCWLYRWHVLRALRKIYRAVHARGTAPTPMADVGRMRRIRDWDTLAIVPRFGFRDANDYYARASVAPHLSSLAVPSLLLLSDADPMVAAGDVRRALPDRAPNLRVEWHAGGGHVHFPRRFGLIERISAHFTEAARNEVAVAPPAAPGAATP
jgi:predicted alpha/beta-fold hydrolase